MQYGGWQQTGQPQHPPRQAQRPPAPGERFDPLAAGANVPSWPDEIPGGPPRLALSGDDGAAQAWPTPVGLPPITTGATEPTIGPRIVVPIVAALVVVAGVLAVPWHKDGSGLFTVAGFFTENGPRDFGDLYATYLLGPLVLVAIGVGFAGNLDSRPLRWVQLLVAVVAWSTAGLLGWQSATTLRLPLVLVVGLGIVASVALVALKRIALRVAAAGYLAVCGLLHAATLALWDAPWLVGYGYLPALGFLIAAVGAAIGPRYVPAHRPW